jgi:hypothetical protein
VLVCVMKIHAFERTIDRLFALSAAADAADIAVDTGTMPARLTDLADDAIHVLSIGTERKRESLKQMRTNLFIKVVVEHDEKEAPERLGAELCRQLERNYLVREAELANFSRVED